MQTRIEQSYQVEVGVKGDLSIWDSTLANIHLPIGADGEVLTADSTTLEGMKWAPPTTGFTSFDLTADSGPVQTITNLNTITITGGDGVTTATSVVDTVTVTVAMTMETFDIIIPTITTTLLTTPTASLPLMVFRNGVLQDEGVVDDFVIAANVLTWAVGLILGERVKVCYFNG